MQKPVNPNASPNAKKLLDFLSESAGHKIITGQHTQTVEMEEVSYIKSITGRFPDVNVLSETHTPWAYYMTWSGEFCMSEKFNTSKKLKSMYQSEYSLKL